MISNIYLVLLFGIVSFFVLRLSWKKGFFSYNEERSFVPLRWFHPLIVFSIYFVIAIFFHNQLVSFLKNFITPIPQVALLCWIAFFMSSLIFVGIFLYCLFLPKETFKKIWHSSTKDSYSKDIQYGLLTCLIVFPLILFLGEFFDLLLYFIFHIKELPDQVAVLFLKMTLDYPFYFFLTIITVIFLAPYIEEMLFRGFLQSFLKNHFSKKIAIGITSVCFAFFHYSPEQGIANLPIIGSLFILSLFLGFIYEKRGSLLAPIVLHAVFNLINVINLYLSKGYLPPVQ